jgi:hypothetical protein
MNVSIKDFESHPKCFENVSYDYFYQEASIFLELSSDESITLEGAQNGYKGLSLLWLGRSDDWSDRELNESIIILDMATKRINDLETLYDMKMIS